MAGLPDRLRGKFRVVLPLSPLLLCSALLTEALLASNLVSACQSTFDCTHFWPTLSYIAAFKGHDRVFSLALTLQSWTLVVFFLAAQTYYRPLVSREAHYLMLGAGCLLSAVLPWIGVLDEVNTASGVALEKVHYWLVVAALFLTGMWSILSLEVEGSHLVQRYMKTVWAITCFSVIQWTFADSVYSSSVLNSDLEALSEWTAVSLGVFAPFVYSRTWPKCEFWLQTS